MSSVNMDSPALWKQDIRTSVDFYNKWFVEYAPKTFKESRIQTAGRVEEVFRLTDCMRVITPEVLIENPQCLSVLRMSTCPPIARDRLSGLSDVSRNTIKVMDDIENPSIPVRKKRRDLLNEMSNVCRVINRLIDGELLEWIGTGKEPSSEEKDRAALVIADRLCGTIADPIIRNAQERRQLGTIKEWLETKGYSDVSGKCRFDEMGPGTFSFRLNVPARVGTGEKTVNIPVDVAIQRMNANEGDLPIFIEAKSAGDYTNTNKRRKEEGEKVNNLRNTYGKDIEFILFLCGYFDAGYLGYASVERIDWIWEHRLSDMEMLQL